MWNSAGTLIISFFPLIRKKRENLLWKSYDVSALQRSVPSSPWKAGKEKEGVGEPEDWNTGEIKVQLTCHLLVVFSELSFPQSATPEMTKSTQSASARSDLLGQEHSVIPVLLWCKMTRRLKKKKKPSYWLIFLLPFLSLFLKDLGGLRCKIMSRQWEVHSEWMYVQMFILLLWVFIFLLFLSLLCDL